MNRWKEQEQQFVVEEEEMYDAEDSFPAFGSTPAIDLVTDSTSKSRELSPINEVEETPILPRSPAASCSAPISIHTQLNVASAGHPTQGIARPELGSNGPLVPQSYGGNVSVQNLVLDDSMNPRLEKIFGWPFPAIVNQPNPSMSGSLPIGMVDITEEIRREEEN